MCGEQLPHADDGVGDDYGYGLPVGIRVASFLEKNSHITIEIGADLDLNEALVVEPFS